MVWACYEKGRGLCSEKGYGYGSGRQKEEGLTKKEIERLLGGKFQRKSNIW